MHVWRVMSKDEFVDCIRSGFDDCLRRDRKGRKVSVKWFASDPGYIGLIVNRGMYHNLRPIDDYNFVVEMDIRGTWVRKKEYGYNNFGLLVNHPFEVGCDISVMTVDEFFEVYKDKIRPLMYYWKNNGSIKKVFDKNEIINIVRNSDLSSRAWFVRADVYNIVNRGIEYEDNHKSIG